MEMFFLFLLGAAWIAIGVYMMYSAIHKDKGVQLPSKNLYGPFLVFPKKGQEWYLFLVGLIWVIVWTWLLLAVVFEW